METQFFTNSRGLNSQLAITVEICWRPLLFQLTKLVEVGQNQKPDFVWFRVKNKDLSCEKCIFKVLSKNYK